MGDNIGLCGSHHLSTYPPMERCLRRSERDIRPRHRRSGDDQHPVNSDVSSRSKSTRSSSHPRTSRADSTSQSCLSLFYLSLQNVTTFLRKQARDRWQSERVDTYQTLATFVLRRFLVLTWVITGVLAIVLTASRGILWPCQSENDQNAVPLDKGTTCIVNRVEMLASITAA